MEQLKLSKQKSEKHTSRAADELRQQFAADWQADLQGVHQGIDAKFEKHKANFARLSEGLEDQVKRLSREQKAELSKTKTMMSEQLQDFEAKQQAWRRHCRALAGKAAENSQEAAGEKLQEFQGEVTTCKSLVQETQQQCRAWVDVALKQLEDLALRTREQLSSMTRELHELRSTSVVEKASSVQAESVPDVVQRLVGNGLAELRKHLGSVSVDCKAAISSLDERLGEEVLRLGAELEALSDEQQRILTTLRRLVKTRSTQVEQDARNAARSSSEGRLSRAGRSSERNRAAKEADWPSLRPKEAKVQELPSKPRESADGRRRSSLGAIVPGTEPFELGDPVLNMQLEVKASPSILEPKPVVSQPGAHSDLRASPKRSQLDPSVGSSSDWQAVRESSMSPPPRADGGASQAASASPHAAG